MADLDKIMTALRNAHAAGDTAAAKRLAAMAKAAQGAPTEAPQYAPNGVPMNAAAKAEIANKAKAGTLPQPSGAKLSAVAAADRVAETKIGNAPTQFGTFAANLAPGVSFGYADEIAAGLDAALTDRTYGQSVEMMRGRDEEMAGAFPKTAIAGQVAGALAIPVPGMGGAKTVKDAAVAGAKVGAATGFLYGTGTGEGGAVERLQNGLEGAIAGGIFGAAAPVAVNFGTKAFQKVFGRAAERPSIESLRTVKRVAYDAVDKSGEKFDPYDIGMIAQKARDALDDLPTYLPDEDVYTAGLLKKLDKYAESGLTISQLDKFRQGAWERYNKSGEIGILDIIDSIDEMIASRAATSELMDAARVANSRFKKAELLDLAFQKASDQTAATGSGGNVLNKMRQAVTNIINNPKQAKWFSAAEIDTMRAFVHGSTGDNVLRQIGKLAPTGNGLMTALNLLGGATFGAPALAVSGIASGSKAIADRSTQRGAQNLIGMVAGQSSQPAARVAIPRVGAEAGLVGNALADRFTARDAYGRPLPAPEY